MVRNNDEELVENVRIKKCEADIVVCLALSLFDIPDGKSISKACQEVS